MNGDTGPDLEDFNPSFLEDGLGIIGEQPDSVEEDLQEWDMNAWSDNSQANEDFIGAGGGCLADAGPPPATGTSVLGSVGGTCQWISTTTCP